MSIGMPSSGIGLAAPESSHCPQVNLAHPPGKRPVLLNSEKGGSQNVWVPGIRLESQHLGD